MRLRTKFEKLEDFVAECAREGVPENTALQRTVEEAKRLGMPVDDEGVLEEVEELREVFEEHYPAGPRKKPKKKQKLRLKSGIKAKPKLNGTHQPLFEWRNAFRSVEDTSTETGLPAGTRHVLLTISMFMDMNGEGAYPGQERIAKDTGLSLNTVKTHIKLAIKQGWLRRKLNHHSKYGIGYSYVMNIPPSAGQPLTGSTHDGVN